MDIGYIETKKPVNTGSKKPRTYQDVTICSIHRTKQPKELDTTRFYLNLRVIGGLIFVLTLIWSLEIPKTHTKTVSYL